MPARARLLAARDLLRARSADPIAARDGFRWEEDFAERRRR